MSLPVSVHAHMPRALGQPGRDALGQPLTSGKTLATATETKVTIKSGCIKATPL